MAASTAAKPVKSSPLASKYMYLQVNTVSDCQLFICAGRKKEANSWPAKNCCLQTCPGVSCLLTWSVRAPFLWIQPFCAKLASYFLSRWQFARPAHKSSILHSEEHKPAPLFSRFSTVKFVHLLSVELLHLFTAFFRRTVSRSISSQVDAFAFLAENAVFTGFARKKVMKYLFSAFVFPLIILYSVLPLWSWRKINHGWVFAARWRPTKSNCAPL